MSAPLVLLLTAIALGLAYRFYGRFLARQVFGLSDENTTPAYTLRDDRDYLPTHPVVLFGHHFASIAGLGPLLGPAIAVIWGWVPALFWILFGSIFIGAVHDFGCLLTSIRNKARTIPDITETVAGNRARILFLLFVIFAMSLAMGVFALYIAKLFSPGAGGVGKGHIPEAVLPSTMLIAIAVTIGLLHYRYRFPLLPLTVGGVLFSLFFVWLGARVPIEGFGGFSLTPPFWTYVLMAYAFIASVLPVWLLLQPRDYINSFQLYLGIALLFAGVLSGNPKIVAPAFNLKAEGLQPLFPMLFITVACGAVSGFHSLVASGTTSKQLARERHALPVGYGAMLTEGLLGALALIACAAGFTGTEWVKSYANWKIAGGNALANFVHGAGTLISHTGLPFDLAKVFIATVAVGFALTTLDSGTRLIRYNIQELGAALRVPGLRNPYGATAVAVFLIGFFALLKVPDPVTGQWKPAGAVLWQLFGTSNQLLAALALLVVSLYLRSLGRPSLYTAAPMGFMVIVTVSALLWKIWEFWTRANWLLLGFSGLLLLLALWLLVEAAMALRRPIVMAR